VTSSLAILAEKIDQPGGRLLEKSMSILTVAQAAKTFNDSGSAAFARFAVKTLTRR